MAFAVHSTYHTTLQKTPGQLVFGRDMIFNLQHEANWEYIWLCKQDIVNKYNARKNTKCAPHTYQNRDKVMLCTGTKNKYECPYSGPHTILQVNMNGTVHLQLGAVTDTVNIRRLTPYVAPNTNHGGSAICHRAQGEGPTG